MRNLLFILLLLPTLGFGQALNDAITEYREDYAGGLFNPILTNSVHMYQHAYGRTYDYGSGAQLYRTNEYGPYTHIINQSHGSSTDTANTYGTTNMPRRTIVWPLKPGSVVQIHGTNTIATGNGAPSGNYGWGGDGTDAPIFVTGTNAPMWSLEESEFAPDGLAWYCTNKASLSTMTGIGANYSVYLFGTNIFVQNLYLTNCVQLNTRPLLHTFPVVDVVLRDLVMDGNRNAGNPTAVSTGGSSGNDATRFTRNLVWARSEASGYGKWDNATESDGCGFIYSQNAFDCFAVDLNLYRMGGDGFRVGADQGDLPSGHHYYILGGTFHNNRENGGDIKQARYVVWSGTKCWNFASTSSSGGEACVLHYTSEETWLINLELYNSVAGFYNGSPGVGTNAWIIGATVHDTTGRAGYFRSSPAGSNWRVLNSTFYGNTGTGSSQGTVVNSEAGATPTMSIENCLFVNNTRDINFTTSSGRANATIRNLMFGPSSEILWSSTYTTGAAWDTAVANVSGILDDDPEFVNASIFDFRLQESSPARGAGVTNLLGLAEAQFLVHIGYALNMRDPNGVVYDTDNPDLGSYHYSAESPAPDAPSSLAATNISPTRNDISWTDNADNESGFELERSAVGSGSGFTQLALIAPSSGTGGTVTYQDLSVLPGETWFYRARSYHATDASAYTSEDSATSATVTVGSRPSAAIATLLTTP